MSCDCLGVSEPDARGWLYARCGPHHFGLLLLGCFGSVRHVAAVESATAAGGGGVNSGQLRRGSTDARVYFNLHNIVHATYVTARELARSSNVTRAVAKCQRHSAGPGAAFTNSEPEACDTMLKVLCGLE